MEINILPKNRKELKEFVIEIITEVNGHISKDEQEEIEKLHENVLDEEYNSTEYLKI